jgi:putative two-component system response regulator
MFFSDSWKRIFGYAPRTEDFIKNLSSDSNLHPDDIPVLLDQLEILKNGGNYQTMEGRIRKADGSYLWCRIRATAIYDETNTISKIIGMIINIDEEKKTASALLQRAEQDPLTKLFNNGTARNYAEKYLRAFPLGARCALIILDLDNFKQINDQHGHMFGDSVLVNTANEIKKLFRSRDIIARIGGDEFLILMKDVADHALVKERCQQLVDSIHKLLNKDSLSYNSSCSIGIAFAPIHGVTYDILFQHADQALYTAKKHGKNCYAIYDDSIN